MSSFVEKLNEIGVEIIQKDNYVRVRRKKGSIIKNTEIITEPPLSTDSGADNGFSLNSSGISKIEENILKTVLLAGADKNGAKYYY